MKEDNMPAALKFNYDTLKKRFQEYQIDINNIKFDYDLFHLGFYCTEFTTLSYNFETLQTQLNLDWSKKVKRLEHINLWDYIPEDRQDLKNLVDFDPSLSESQENAKSKISQVQPSTLDEVQAPSVLPVSPSQVRVK